MYVAFLLYFNVKKCSKIDQKLFVLKVLLEILFWVAHLGMEFYQIYNSSYLFDRSHIFPKSENSGN